MFALCQSLFARCQLIRCPAAVFVCLSPILQLFYAVCFMSEPLFRCEAVRSWTICTLCGTPRLPPVQSAPQASSCGALRPPTVSPSLQPRLLVVGGCCGAGWWGGGPNGRGRTEGKIEEVSRKEKVGEKMGCRTKKGKIWE